MLKKSCWNCQHGCMFNFKEDNGVCGKLNIEINKVRKENQCNAYICNLEDYKPRKPNKKITQTLDLLNQAISLLKETTNDKNKI